VYLNRIVPGLLDHYLARKGYEAQQSKERDDPARPDNVDEPLRGDHGAHGRFDRQARSRSLLLEARTRLGDITARVLQR
jgi:hypothetical protein